MSCFPLSEDEKEHYHSDSVGLALHFKCCMSYVLLEQLARVREHVREKVDNTAVLPLLVVSLDFVSCPFYCLMLVTFTNIKQQRIKIS